MPDIFKAEARLKDYISEKFKHMESVVTGSSKKMSGASGKTTGAFGKLGGMAKRSAASIGSLAARFGPAAIAAGALTIGVMKLRDGLRQVQESTENLEASLSKMSAIVQPTSGEFKALERQARMLGQSTMFTAGQVTEAFVEMGKLGMEANEIIDASAGTLNLAALAQVEMGEASRITAAALNQFGLEAIESDRVVDVMAKSFNSSALDINKFSEAMKMVGPIAGTTGTSIEETTAVLSVLADRGIDASLAGTALRRIMLELADSNSDVSKKIAATGMETDTLTQKIKALEKADISAAEAKELFGVRSVSAIKILTQNADAVDDLNKEYIKAKGTGDEFADVMMDNVKGATILLKSAQDDLAISIGKAFGKGKQKAIEDVTAEIKKLSETTKAVEIPMSILGEKWHEFTAKSKINFMRTMNSLLLDFMSLIGTPPNTAWMDDIEKLEGIKEAASNAIKLKESTDAANKSVYDVYNTFGGIYKTTNELRGEATELQNEYQTLNLIMGKGTVTEKTNLEDIINLVDKKIQGIKDVAAAEKDAAAAKTNAEALAAARAADADGGGASGGGDPEKAASDLKDRLARLKQIEMDNARQTWEGKRQLMMEQSAADLEMVYGNKEKEHMVLEFWRRKFDELDQAQHDETLEREQEANALMDGLRQEGMEKELEERKYFAKEKRRIRQQEIDDHERGLEVQKRGMQNLLDAEISMAGEGMKAMQKNEKDRQKVALIMSIVEGMLAVQRALANPPGPPYSIPQAIATGILAAGNTAMIASQAFQEGGFPQGHNAMIRVNEAGQEAVLNAGATAKMGFGGVNALNSGQQVSRNVVNEISYSPTINIQGEASDRLINELRNDREEFARFFKEDVQAKGYLD